MSVHTKTAIVIAFFLIALGLAGADDYRHAICEVNPSDCEMAK